MMQAALPPSFCAPDKIHSRHRERSAMVYVRQSTMQQVEHHRESTRLQHALAELKGNDWSSICGISVSVDHGMVRLDGLVQSAAVRTGLRVAVEQVPGVTEVENRVAVIDPLVGVTGY